VYQYEGAVVQMKESRGRWVSADLSLAPVATLFDTYMGVYLILSHYSLDHKVSLDLSEVASEISGLVDTATVTDWLTLRGDRTLPTSDVLPTITTKQVKYNDAWQAGYTMNFVHPFYHVDTQIMETEKTDVLMVREDTDYEQFYKNCLVTVNGLIHRTDFDEYGIRIKDAGTSVRQANENHIGILSFREIGEIEIINITEDMIYNPNPGAKLKEAAYLKVEQSMEGKVVMLVLGGYLHVLESYYYAIGDHAIKIDMANFPFIQRFYASKKLLDMSNVMADWQSDPNNDEHFAISDLFSDTTIKKYLTMSQSFIVLLDADNLYVEKHKVEYTGLPGRYYAHSRPEFPLRTELGRLPEYIAIPETDIWVLAIQDNFSTKYRFEATNYRDEPGIDPQRETLKPVYYAQGHLLEIGSDIAGFTPTTA